MKKDVNYSGGVDTIFYEASTGIFLSYELDGDYIHEKCGGEQYYISNSGLSGAGYIERIEDLVEFGFYRTDVKNEQRRKTVFKTEPDFTSNAAYTEYREIFGYVPIASHNGLCFNDKEKAYPIVLTDGKLVVYSHPSNFYNWLKKWEDVKDAIFHGEESALQEIFRELGKDPEIDPVQYKKLVIKGYSFTHSYEKEIDFINEESFRGLDVLRFCNLHDLRESANEFEQDEEDQRDYPLLQKLVGVDLYNSIAYGDALLFRRHYLGFYDKEIPIKKFISGEAKINGWKTLEPNSYIWFKRIDNYKVKIFKELEVGMISSGRYKVAREKKYIDFELEFSVFDFYKLDKEKIIKMIDAAILRKAETGGNPAPLNLGLSG